MSERSYSSPGDRVRSLLAEIGELSELYGTATRLMAVTKFRDAAAITQAVEAGVALVGENRPQEFRDKLPLFEDLGCEKHLIGNLQTNKLKYVVGKADVIESISSLELAKAVSDFALSKGVCQRVLLEVNAGREQSKSGFLPEELTPCIQELAALPGISIKGIMSMAPAGDTAAAERAFSEAQKLFIDIGNKKLDNVSMDFLSMGMSQDFKLAIKHGSNIVRLGRAVFGY